MPAPVFDVLLYQPEIPPNTGNVIRLCANTGARLHLIEPLGFSMEDRQLRRAGLDYHEYASVQVHPDLATALERISPRRLFALSTRGQVRHDQPAYADGDNTGLMLDGVRDDSPAAKAGVKAGDKIVKLAGRDIRNISDYVYVLGEMKPGEEYEIVVVRGGEKLSLKITPVKR